MSGRFRERGLWIVIDGGDCSGKSSQRRRLVEDMQDLGLDVVSARDPGGTPKAERIRNQLLNGDSGEEGNLAPDSQLALFTAARIELYNDVIRPALDEGKVVVLDRWISSTYAYQCFDEDQRRKFDLLNEAFGFDETKMPDMTVVLDGGLPARERIDGAVARGESETYFESWGRRFHQEVQERFREFCAQAPETRQLVDATDDIEITTQRVYQAINPALQAVKGVRLPEEANLFAMSV